MIRQIKFYLSDSIITDIIFFEWDGKSSVMDSAFERLKSYMDVFYPGKSYEVVDWWWADKGI